MPARTHGFREDAPDARTVVERELEFELVLGPRPAARTPVAVPTRLVYRVSDPYAVHIAFHIDTPDPVSWTFGRDLLIDGVYRPSGEGDVRIWPATVHEERSAICLLLSAPDGNAVLRAPATALTAWLERTMRLVPPGDERLLVPATP
ncbi:SsgA family sporulation/cell division regulator [Streptomyces sp. PKU-EA00015]|uniref:SsgA family sporulation/cell division regulator n=1 Tax=Streptomyces sp. PKU-EA00015 TaxID=2748326 RepID=UPI0015A03946|nr:SsgA family sporulation/cell division regulator [Streptomyces sp. PKU-EA00015]NWF24878.1 SsgA family sporulation/cell division regulator [Streptomyces sp. PKU-EA00015]